MTSEYFMQWLSINGFTQTSFAAFVGHGYSTINDYCTGKTGVPGVLIAFTDAVDYMGREKALEFIEYRRERGK